MSNEERLDELFKSLHAELVKLPATRTRDCALSKLELCIVWTALAIKAADGAFDLVDEA